MIPSVQTLYDVCEGTWPPLHSWVSEGWTFRDGAGGGKRVSAATASALLPDVDRLTTRMRGSGQQPLVMVREGEVALDEHLASKGFKVVDPVNMYACPVEALTDVPIPRVTAFAIWEPLAIMEEIWATGGIGPNRIDVMARAKCKTGILSRWNEKPAGVAFAGVHDRICMVHAVEVLPHQRRQGVAVWMMRKAAFWAEEQGATHVSVLCTQANEPANALYSSLGMTCVGQYHYRQLGA